MADWLDELKRLLGIDAADTSQDTQILFLAGIALQMVQLRTGRTFLHAQFRDTVHAPRGTIYLSEFPVESIEEVNNGGAAMDPSAYRLDSLRGIIRFDSECCCWVQSPACCRAPVQVTYSANPEDPPAWLLLLVSDAIRAGMSAQSAGNAYGFSAKKVAVTDVGSIEFDSLGATPADSMTAAIDAGLAAWPDPVFAGSRSCGEASQFSEVVAVIPPASKATVPA